MSSSIKVGAFYPNSAPAARASAAIPPDGDVHRCSASHPSAPGSRLFTWRSSCCGPPCGRLPPVLPSPPLPSPPLSSLLQPDQLPWYSPPQLYIGGLRIKELQECLERLGLRKGGKKLELQQRLLSLIEDASTM
jgi:hypothetical protein